MVFGFIFGMCVMKFEEDFGFFYLRSFAVDVLYLLLWVIDFRHFGCATFMLFLFVSECLSILGFPMIFKDWGNCQVTP